MQSIPIDNLLLSLDNPRLDEAKTELEAIRNMLIDQNEKLLVLAEDIVEHGLSPLDAIAIYPSTNNSGKYIVAEGNRRTAAIKILNNPQILFNTDQNFYKKFLKLTDNYSPIKHIESHIFKSESDPLLMHWMGIKHLGEQQGKGISKWNSIQKARYLKKMRGEDLLIDFWIELVDNKVLSYDEVMSITKTNWERILRNTGLEFLGLSKVVNKLILPYNDIDMFTRKIRKIHKKLANQTVKIVYDQEAIEAFYNEISQELCGVEYPLKQEQFNVAEERSIQPQIDFKSEINNPNIKHVDNNDNVIFEETAKNSKDLFSNCNTIIPKKLSIKSDNVRINKIINELKSIEVDSYPNSCGTLLRLLFELSAKYYLEKSNNNNDDLTNKSFDDVIKQSANCLRKNMLINNSDHSAIMSEVNLLRLLFNGYMHNIETYPSSEALKSIFKAHKKFLLACLNH